ncbi:hypothetical protein GCM10020258_30630 [Sphingomonas yabuuchiae]
MRSGVWGWGKGLTTSDFAWGLSSPPSRLREEPGAARGEQMLFLLPSRRREGLGRAGRKG